LYKLYVVPALLLLIHGIWLNICYVLKSLKYNREVTKMDAHDTFNMIQ